MAVRYALIVALALASPALGQGATLQGEPTILDGRTLELNGRRVRLWGIDAPDLAQICTRMGRDYPCGRVARAALWDLVAGQEVVCTPVAGAEAAGDLVLATCTAGGFSLNENMVHTGWALADRAVTEDFVRVQKGAKKAGRGLWSGDFAPPWEWRERQAEGPAAAPADGGAKPDDEGG